MLSWTLPSSHFKSLQWTIWKCRNSDYTMQGLYWKDVCTVWCHSEVSFRRGWEDGGRGGQESGSGSHWARAESKGESLLATPSCSLGFCVWSRHGSLKWCVSQHLCVYWAAVRAATSRDTGLQSGLLRVEMECHCENNMLKMVCWWRYSSRSVDAGPRSNFSTVKEEDSRARVEIAVCGDLAVWRDCWNPGADERA